MSDFDPDSPLENDWSERGDLAWNEFDWERYLREQDEAIQLYLARYEELRRCADRIDAVAEQMGWEQPEIEDDEPAGRVEEDDPAPDFDDGDQVYTLHKNPVFIATKAIYLGLKRPWEVAASAESSRIPTALAVSYLVSLHRGEEQASQAVHALDFGDYAMAVSLFKRALAGLNQSLAILSSDTATKNRAVASYREEALPRLFDLREIWLRVINECREELDRPGEE